MEKNGHKLRERKMLIMSVKDIFPYTIHRFYETLSNQALQHPAADTFRFEDSVKSRLFEGLWLV